MLVIPIEEAEEIANEYGYDHVVILAMSPSKTKERWFDGCTTTFNKDKSKCDFLGKIGTILHSNLRSFYCMEKLVENIYDLKVTFQNKFKSDISK